MKKQNKGITLIALIVTIVVLIIIAGIALSIALGDNGIFNKAKLSADTYVNSAANEVAELKKAESIMDELIESQQGPYGGRATEDEVHPEIFKYEILTPATASIEEGVDGVTKLADTSDILKIADTVTTPTAKIKGINYTAVFGSLPEYEPSEYGAGSGYDGAQTEASKEKFANFVRTNYSKLVIPVKVKLNASGQYDANGEEYTITQVGACGFGYDSCLDDDKLLVYPFIHNVTEIILPNTITSLTNDESASDNTQAKWSAFGYAGISTLKLPKGLKSIGVGAFYCCNNLQSVSISSNVTTIGEEAFKYCVNLSEVFIPQSVSSIGEYAFYELKENSKIYVETQAVADLLEGKYDSDYTTVIVDPSKF